MSIKKDENLSIDDVLKSMGVDPRMSVHGNAPRNLFEVSFENVRGDFVAFTVEHSNKLVLKKDIANMPVSLQSDKPKLRIVDAPAKAHFSFDEWMQLTALSSPGTWYYLGVPSAYKEAKKIYERIDPLGRVFGG